MCGSCKRRSRRRGVPAVAELGEHSVRLRWQLESLAARHDRHPDPPQPGDACRRCLPGLCIAPTTRRSTSSSSTTAVSPRPTTRGTRRTRRASICRCSGGPRPVQLLAGQQRGGGWRARRGARLPQRRHRAASTRRGCARWSAGPSRPRSASSGLQLIGADGKIQHAGVILGMGGFADHVFEGMAPGSDSLLGPTDWYRNVLAVTGACLAIRRETVRRARRVRRAVHPVRQRRRARPRHALSSGCATCARRSAACGTSSRRPAASAIPTEDFFASYWRYKPWVFGRRSVLLAEPVAVEPQAETARSPTSRRLPAGWPARWGATSRCSGSAATPPSRRCSPTRAGSADVDVAAVANLHAANAANARRQDDQLVHPRHRQPVLRRHQHRAAARRPLARTHGVQNRFVVWASGPDILRALGDRGRVPVTCRQ